MHQLHKIIVYICSHADVSAMTNSTFFIRKIYDKYMYLSNCTKILVIFFLVVKNLKK